MFPSPLELLLLLSSPPIRRTPAKLESYASPPLSPPAHWSLDPNRVCRDTLWDRLGGMDGDTRRMKQHEQARFATRAEMAGRAVSRPSGAATDRFRQAALQSARGDAPSQATGRGRMPTYLDYGYPDGAFPGGSLQGDELQPYAPTLRDQQRQPVQQQPSFAGYESEMVYNLSQQGPTQSPYEVVPPYPTRQSAAMDALSSQFAVPQYYNEPTGAGVPAVGSPYLASQLPLAAYNQPGPIGRSGTTQPFPATMADMTPVGTTGRLEPSPPSQLQSQSQQPPAQGGEPLVHPNESYGQFHQALRETFQDTRAGRLVEASRSLLNISEWLVTNARELGMFRP